MYIGKQNNQVQASRPLYLHNLGLLEQRLPVRGTRSRRGVRGVAPGPGPAAVARQQIVGAVLDLACVSAADHIGKLAWQTQHSHSTVTAQSQHSHWRTISASWPGRAGGAMPMRCACACGAVRVGREEGGHHAYFILNFGRPMGLKVGISIHHPQKNKMRRSAALAGIYR